MTSRESLIHLRVIRGLVLIVALVTVVAALRLARIVVMPLTLATMLYLLLLPVISLTDRIRVPRPVASVVLIGTLVAVSSLAFATLAEPALTVVDELPSQLETLERRLRTLREPVEAVQAAAAEVDSMTNVGEEGSDQVTVRAPGLAETVFGHARTLLGGYAVVLATLFFLLPYGQDLMRAVTAAAVGPDRLGAALPGLRRTERQVSRYLATITTVNLTLGATVAGVMALCGVPTPVLWGVVAGAANFMPYVGAMLTAASLGIVTLATIPDLSAAVLPVLLYVILTTVEGTFVTPMILGRVHRINPLVVFVWLMLWGWLWGIGGLVVAIPILVTLKLVCAGCRPLRPVAQALQTP